MAAFLDGPKHGIPLLSRISTNPNTSGSSGATTQKSMFILTAKSVMPSKSVALMLTHSASFAMPPFPGHAKISVTSGFSFNFLIMACSLPPAPTTSIFILETSYCFISDGKDVFL